MINAAEQRWAEYRDRLLQDVGAAKDVAVQIPGWKPVGFSEGLRWLQATLYEGFKVRHEILRSGDQTAVNFEVWEE